MHSTEEKKLRGKNYQCWGLSTALVGGKWTVAWKVDQTDLGLASGILVLLKSKLTGIFFFWIFDGKHDWLWWKQPPSHRITSTWLGVICREKKTCLRKVVAKWLERQSHNLEVPSLNPPGARAFFSSSINGRVSLIRSLKIGASLLYFL